MRKLVISSVAIAVAALVAGCTPSCEAEKPKPVVVKPQPVVVQPEPAPVVVDTNSKDASVK